MDEANQLPRIRQDLQLFAAPALRDGSPSWTLHDPLRNRYFRIGWQEFELLSRFHLHSVKGVVEEAARIGVENVQERLQQLIRFLHHNELVESLEQSHGSHSEKSWLSRALFVKIPLLRPDRFLQKIYPWFSPLFHPLFMFFLAVTGALSLLLVVQQWDSFFATFTELTSPRGVAMLVMAILFSKMVHEMGHALMAKHYGLQVPTFGVAFLFFWPVFYTDGSDGWRLRSRRARLMIGGAGVMAEGLLAIIATLVWVWAPEGMIKSVAFTLAVTTWGMTLLVNLNPFMRFDGYFLLADFWEIPNLQQRAFALGREQLRSWLLGVPSPQRIAGAGRYATRKLVGYAWLTWIYRLSIYIGLALLAYHYLFKLLGVLLLVAELSVLVIRPIQQELKVYWSLRKQFCWTKSNRIAVAMVLLLLFALLFPWQQNVKSPAVWKQGVLHQAIAAEAGRVVEIHVVEMDEVVAGDPLVTLEFPELEYQKRALEEQIVEQQSVIRQEVVGEKHRDRRLIEQQQLEKLYSRLSEIEARIEEGQIVAPLSGRVVELTQRIRKGESAKRGETVVVISSTQPQGQVDAWFYERDLQKLKVGAKGQFYPEFGGLPVPVHLVEIAVGSSPWLDQPMLSSLYGGELPVRVDQQQQSRLQDSYYRVRLQADAPLQSAVGEVRGVVVVDAEPAVKLIQGWNWIESVLIRESGF